MLFVDNFIHGDLHCKNWKIRTNDTTKKTQIVVYDCGICFKNINTDLTQEFWFALVHYDIEKLIIILKDFIKENNDINIDYFNHKLFDNDIHNLFKHIIEESLGTSLIMNILLNLFKLNNLVVHKFMLNFTILICVIEEYMRNNNLINKHINKNISLFHIINNNQLDIITFCDVKKCYPKVKNMIELNMKDNYKKYKKNSCKNNIENIDNSDDGKQLFTRISLSGLTFKSPE